MYIFVEKEYNHTMTGQAAMKNTQNVVPRLLMNLSSNERTMKNDLKSKSNGTKHNNRKNKQVIPALFKPFVCNHNLGC
jgi:hypothetical protein